MRFFSNLGAVLLLVVGAQTAPAAPILSATTTDLGGGLFAYDITLDGQDGEYRSFFAQAFTFTGEIVGFAGWHFDDDPFASYLHAPWTNNGMGAPVYSAGGLTFSAGTGGSSEYLSLPVARLVVAGDLSVSGSIGRDGLLYDFAGSFSTAESFATIASLLGPNQVFPDAPVSPPVFEEVTQDEPSAPQDEPSAPQDEPVAPPQDPVDEIRVLPMPVSPVVVIENPIGFPDFGLPIDGFPKLVLDEQIFIDSEPPVFLTGEVDGLIESGFGLWLPDKSTMGNFVTDSGFTDSGSTDGGFSFTSAMPRGVVSTPEPATWLLATTGLLTIGVLGRLGRRR
jgi:hypothetical protein